MEMSKEIVNEKNITCLNTEAEKLQVTFYLQTFTHIYKQLKSIDDLSLPTHWPDQSTAMHQ